MKVTSAIKAKCAKSRKKGRPKRGAKTSPPPPAPPSASPKGSPRSGQNTGSKTSKPTPTAAKGKGKGKWKGKERAKSPSKSDEDPKRECSISNILQPLRERMRLRSSGGEGEQVNIPFTKHNIDAYLIEKGTFDAVDVRREEVLKLGEGVFRVGEGVVPEDDEDDLCWQRAPDLKVRKKERARRRVEEWLDDVYSMR
ncbi:uncharacterized protein GIQ15_05565 [Arthroderma uncinatum]|uniref:uncharacterized protein n=1 Tax=Arthroderma uncinatum TaxID=74035 RepID=UPI00144AF652|nr:uncharacterized protein GIQ15_05565 [Arthroderma uncinatum]KAF3480218.1 hypothetical protein GIQ15_05565 [Arthroderma uncinatum]